MMRRFAFLIGLLLLLVPGMARPVTAGETWCADDPVVAIGGHLLDIQVQMPVADVLTMRSTTVTVVIPQNVAGTVLVDDVSAFPMHTSVVPAAALWNGTGAIPITVVVTVTAATDYVTRVVTAPLLDLAVPLAPPTTVTGTANTPIKAPVVLGH